ncbi:hypothetical protein D9M68_1000070 [compost metagenome]
MLFNIKLGVFLDDLFTKFRDNENRIICTEGYTRSLEHADSNSLALLFVHGDLLKIDLIKLGKDIARNILDTLLFHDAEFA